MKKKLSTLGKAVAITNLLVAIPVILAYLATNVSPEKQWFYAFFGLAFPAFLFLNIAFLVIWAVRRHVMVLLPLIVLLVGFGKMKSYFSLHLFASNDIEKGIKVMTFNVQNFDLYNWSHNISSRDSIMAMLKKHAPDIVCFQEFYSEDKGEFNNELILRKTGYPHQYFKKNLSLKGGKHFGLAIASKFPIVKAGKYDFPNSKNHGCIYTDLLNGDDTIRLFNVHLQSIHFQADDYAYIDKVANTQNPDVKSSRRILSKLKHGFIKRASQADIVADAIGSSPYPVVVCGDLNDTPISYAYHQVSKGLKDAFLRKGWGVGRTYAGNIEGLRIDYVFLSKHFSVNGFRIIKKRLSDHFPVLCSFELKE